MATNCPACGKSIASPRARIEHEMNICVFGALIGIINDRNEERGGHAVNDKALDELDLAVPDDLWERFIGPAIDWLEDRFREQTNADLAPREQETN